jgi:hypothetical protein
MSTAPRRQGHSYYFLRRKGLLLDSTKNGLGYILGDFGRKLSDFVVKTAGQLDPKITT